MRMRQIVGAVSECQGQGTEIAAMDFWYLLLTLIFGGILAFLYWLYTFAVAPFRVLSRLGIPGPPPVPFYGNQKTVAKMGRQSFITTMLERYGSVFGYYLGQVPVVVTSDLEILKEILVKQFDSFHDRPPQPGLLRKKSSTPRGLFSASGAYWKKIRVTLSPSFSSVKMKMMTPLIEDRCKTLQSVLAEFADTDKSVEVTHIFGNLSMESVIAAAFGRVVEIQRGESDNLVDAARHIFAVVGEGSQFSSDRIYVLLSNFPCVLPILRLLASRSKSGDAYETMKELALGLIRARRESPDANNHRDLLGLMLDATSDERDPQSKLTDEEVMAQCIILIIAGYDTTGNMLAFTAYLLATHPHIQDKLIGEIKRYSSGEHSSVTGYDKVQEMTYLDMVIQESLRVYPPAFLPTRYCNKTTTLGNVTFPKGAHVAIPLWNILHDPQYWPQPEKFDPDRFTEEEKEKRPSITHIAFGWGPRTCIGARFALLEAKLAFIAILTKYKFVRAPETEDPLQLKYGVTIAPKNPLFLRIVTH